MKIKFSFLICLLATILFAVPSHPASYSELSKRLNSNNPPDSSYLQSLPKPKSAHDYWLRSQIQPNISQALSDLRKAIQRSNSRNVSRYLSDWIKLMMMDVKQQIRFKFLSYHLNRIPGNESPQVWLLAGKLAFKKDKYKKARKWFNRAKKASDLEAKAQLELSKVAMARGNFDRADRILDHFMEQHSRGSRPEYWYIRGRLYQKQEADSEAYLAYSHIVNHYPNNPLTERAESKLNNLPMPDSLYTAERSSDQSAAMNRTKKSRDKASSRQGGFRIQVGSFVNRRRAGELKSKLERNVDESVVIREAIVGGRKYYRVQVTGFNSREEASEQLKKLKSRGFKGYIVKGEDQ